MNLDRPNPNHYPPTANVPSVMIWAGQIQEGEIIVIHEAWDTAWYAEKDLSEENGCIPGEMVMFRFQALMSDATLDLVLPHTLPVTSLGSVPTEAHRVDSGDHRNTFYDRGDTFETRGDTSEGGGVLS